MHDYSISLYQYRLVGFFVLLLYSESVIHTVLQQSFLFFSFTNDHDHFSKSVGIPKVCMVFPCMHMLEFIN